MKDLRESRVQVMRERGQDAGFVKFRGPPTGVGALMAVESLLEFVAFVRVPRPSVTLVLEMRTNRAWLSRPQAHDKRWRPGPRRTQAPGVAWPAAT